MANRRRSRATRRNPGQSSVPPAPQPTPTPPPQLPPPLQTDPKAEQEALKQQVRLLDMQALSWKNILTQKLQANVAAKEETGLRKAIVNLGKDQAKNAIQYKQQIQSTANYEKQIQATAQEAREAAVKGNFALSTQKLGELKLLDQQLKLEKEKENQLKKTAGGALMAQALEAKKKKDAFLAEKNLIKEINAKRAEGNKLGRVGVAISDLFKSKERKQREITAARAAVGGGVNTPPGKAAGGAGSSSSKKQDAASIAAAAGGPWAAVLAKVTAAVQAIKDKINQISGMAVKAITAPFADAAQLLTGEGFGMGGGKLKTTGAGSILGGMQEFASAIPVVGGLLGGLVGIVKTIVEGILGIEQGVFRFARAMNISYGEAERMKSSFNAIAVSSGNIAINSTRMMQSQVEIGTQLGINKQLSADILKNDVLLRDVIGTEAGVRQSIAETSIIAGQNAAKLTKNLIGSVGAFNKMVGTSYSFNGIMRETSKLTGVIGLQFSKYPEKVAKTLMTVKTLGMELQQLDSVASSLLDFESSISAEMEAQVLTGRDMNLTLAREAALNNDYATLAREITKNVGKTSDFLSMDVIKREAIAKSVGMTADSLADVLRKQELYGRLNATDLKTFTERIALMEKAGKTQKEISDMIGKDAYNEYTRISTAERITEVLEQMKRTFVELIKSSGIFDFITKPERITAFVRRMADILAGAISMTGQVIASLMEGVAYIVSWFSDEKAREIRSLATGIRYGTGTFAESMRTATGTIGQTSTTSAVKVNTETAAGTPAPSVGNTVQASAKKQTQVTAAAPVTAKAEDYMYKPPIQIVNIMKVGDDVLAKSDIKTIPQQHGSWIS